MAITKQQLSNFFSSFHNPSARQFFQETLTRQITLATLRLEDPLGTPMNATARKSQAFVNHILDKIGSCHSQPEQLFETLLSLGFWATPRSPIWFRGYVAALQTSFNTGNP